MSKRITPKRWMGESDDRLPGWENEPASDRLMSLRALVRALIASALVRERDRDHARDDQ